MIKTVEGQIETSHRFQRLFFLSRHQQRQGLEGFSEAIKGTERREELASSPPEPALRETPPLSTRTKGSSSKITLRLKVITLCTTIKEIPIE